MRFEDMKDVPLTCPHILIDKAKKFPLAKTAIREKEYDICLSYSKERGF